MKILRNKTYYERLREKEKQGHRLALAEFKDADEIIVGPCVITGCDIYSKKVVIIGDNSVVGNCVFSPRDGETLLDIR